MRLIALGIPDEVTALAGWLEGHLVGMDLAELIGELEAVHGPATESLSLDRVLEDWREVVRTQGLGSLPPDLFDVLLRQPKLLLDLQEWLLIEGGPYWQRLAAGATGRHCNEILERAWDRLASALAESDDPAPAIPLRPPVAAAPVRPARPPAWLLGGLAAAAAGLVALVVAMRGPGWGGGGTAEPAVVAAKRWGWDRPGAFPNDLPRAAYLNHLADSAIEWFDRRPEAPLELARRIAEFRQGCTILILSPHRPLSPEDRAWLVERCHGWAAKLDAHLAAVESGQDVLRVRDEVDAMINRLIRTLRERAMDAGGSGVRKSLGVESTTT
jgi:hypothetical protein